MKDKNELQNQLKNLYNELLVTKIPLKVNNEQLSDWIDEILLLDTYYAGWALSVSNGGKVRIKELENVTHHQDTLKLVQISKYDLEDFKAFEQCKTYIQLLVKIDRILRELSNI